MVFGRAHPPQPTPPPPNAELDRLYTELGRLSAAADEVLDLVGEAMRANRGNRVLVDLALDVQNMLRAGKGRST